MSVCKMFTFTTQHVVIEFPERMPDCPEPKAFQNYSNKKRITIPMTRRRGLSTVKCDTRVVNRRTVSLVFLPIRYILSEALLWRITRAVKREFRVLFFRTNQKSACKPVSMYAQSTVCVSAYKQRIEAVLFNYRGLYHYRCRRKQRVNSLVPVPRGSQVPCLFRSGTLQNLYV